MPYQITKKPDRVEFSTELPSGAIKVIQVFPLGGDPRILAFVEYPDTRREPISLWLSEIEGVVQKTKEVLRD